MGRVDAALASADRGLAALGGMHEVHLPDERHLGLCRWMALLLGGRLAEADALARDGHERVLRRGAEHARGQWCYQLGLGALWSGRVREAAGWFQQATAVCQEHDPTRVLVLSLAGLAEAPTVTGDHEAAAAALAAAANVLPHERVWVELGEAWVTALRGERAAGRAVALRAAGIAAEQGFLALEAHALHTVVRLGDPAPVRERLAGCEGAHPRARRRRCRCRPHREGA